MTSTVCTTSEAKIPFPRINYAYSQNSNAAGAPLPRIPRRTSSYNNSKPGHISSMSAPSLSSLLNVNGAASLYVHSPQPHELPARSSTAPVGGKHATREDDSDTSSSSTPSDEVHPTILPRSKRTNGQWTTGSPSSGQSTPPPMGSNSNLGSAEIEPTQRMGSAEVKPSIESADDDGFRLSQPSKQPPNAKALGLHLNLDSVQTRALSEVHIDILTETQAVLPSADSTVSLQQASSSSVDAGRLIRKKAGLPIKSSLKSGKHPPLSVVTFGAASKSEPSTPTHTKAVRFDAKLEHVKLFLAEQKPLAVSRDGSPTTDTSGTDNEFPSFIYGSSDDERAVKQIEMQLPNMPVYPAKNADVALQELALSQDTRTIHGRVRVRNIAFEKRLAVRFTFDWWQTTSEVTARFVESVEYGEFDIFGFAIRLHDIWARIEEKMMLLAIRYNVTGQEIWDNNAGQNYLVKFSKKTSTPSSPEAKGLDVTPMADLKDKLEQVAQGREPFNGGFLTNRSRRVRENDSVKPPALTSNTHLSSRYDFASALKSPWTGGRPPSPPGHFRNNTFPSSSPNTIPFPTKPSSPTAIKSPPPRAPTAPRPLGSPRDADDEGLRHYASYTGSELEDVLFPVTPPLRRSDGSRNHQRSYFERPISQGSGIRRTSPGSPPLFGRGVTVTTPPTPHAVVNGQLSRLHSFPPADNTPVPATAGWSSPFGPNAWSGARSLATGGSEESTPAFTAASLVSSPSLSPRRSTLAKPGEEQSPITPSSSDSYSLFLNRFCFYTGSDQLPDTPTDSIPRSHSASDVEEFLWSQSSSPNSSFLPTPRQSNTPPPSTSHRSSNLADAID